jgi:hypothetical protein
MSTLIRVFILKYKNMILYEMFLVGLERILRLNEVAIIGPSGLRAVHKLSFDIGL